MKNVLIFIACLLIAVPAQTQEMETVNSDSIYSESPLNPNLIKFNVLTSLGGKFSFEYERIINKKFSAGLAISFRPEKHLPFKSTIMDWVGDEEINSFLDDIKISSTAIIPEIRYYISKQGNGHGFYIAPYLKFSKLKYSMPYTYDVSIEYNGQLIYDREETIRLNGDMSTFTVGLSAGINFKLSKNLFLDWRILGPGLGTTKGNVGGQLSLNEDEQRGLREELDAFNESLADFPGSFKIDYTVNSEGADILLKKSPWASLRTGLSLAYRF